MSIKQTPSIDEQQQFWNWHWRNWESRKVMNDWTERRSTEMLRLIRSLPLNSPRMLDLGCGRGWFTERMADLGEAHGIDLSTDGIEAAKARRPDITYMAGSVYDAPLTVGYFDVVVSSEVIAHVENQPQYIARASEVLRPGGYLIITTGNKFVMDRLGEVGWNTQPPQHIARQLSHGGLKKLLSPQFEVLRTFTIIPHGNRGILRVVNSYRLNKMLAAVLSERRLERWKEALGLGWQMIFLAQKRSNVPQTRARGN